MKAETFADAVRRLLGDHAQGLLTDGELRFEVGVEVDRGRVKCIYCGQRFVPLKPTTTICRFCYYDGRHHEAQRADMFDALRAIPGVEIAGIDHTGGGCFSLGIRLLDKRFLCGTLAYQEKDGQWSCDGGVPQPGTPWALGIYTDADLESAEAEDMRLPLTDDALVEAVREIVGRPVRLVETPPPSKVEDAPVEDACPCCGWVGDWREFAQRGHSIDVWCGHCGGIVQAG